VSERNQELLEAELGQAFQSGDLGLSALLLWELRGRFPDSAVAHIYAKKLMRLPELSGIQRESIVAEAKPAFAERDYEQLAQLMAIGLLLSPRDRDFAFLMAECGAQLARNEWVPLAIDPLGQPQEGDVELLNAVGALALERGDFGYAGECFTKLLVQMPDNEPIIKNTAAALYGAEKYADGIALLEKNLGKSPDPIDRISRLISFYQKCEFNVSAQLRALDEKHFCKPTTSEMARAHTALNVFLENHQVVADAQALTLSLDWSAGVAFQLAETQLVLGQYSDALENYRYRFAALPDLLKYPERTKPYEGQHLTEQTLFLWFEQGIGEEILFAYFLDELSQRVENATIVMDGRLLPMISCKYPQWTFINELDFDSPPETDYVCSAGRLFELFLPDFVSGGKPFSYPLVTPDSERLAVTRAALPETTRKRIAVSWRGGIEKTNGNVRSMSLDQLMAGLPSDAPIDVVSLQYDDGHEQEVIDLGDRRIAISGLDNKNDFPGIFSLLACCDAVLTVDNALAHFATALGVPTYVVVPMGQVQFRWKNPALRQLFFPSAQIFVQETPGDWAPPVKEAWAKLISDAEDGGSGNAQVAEC